MKESRVYSFAMLAGVVLLLAGIALHSWLSVAAGAMIAGAGGVFGMLATWNGK
jgi:hypothetical protein